MVGSNCTLPGCGTSRRDSYSGIGIFRIPQRKTQDYVEWKNKTLDVVKKYRIVDGEFKRQIEAGSVYVCERHYQSEDIEYTSKFKLFFA